MSPSSANSRPRPIQMTRTYLAKFSMPGAGDDVQLGMTATLILSDPASERVARLPLSALFNQGDGPSLYVADGKTGAITLKPCHRASLTRATTS